MSQIIDLSQGIETGQHVYPESAVTIDRDPPYPAHVSAKEFEYYHLENLTQIDRLAAKRFRFAGFPLKLIGPVEPHANRCHPKGLGEWITKSSSISC